MSRALVVAVLLALAAAQRSSTTYLFSYFVGNGEDYDEYTRKRYGAIWSDDLKWWRTVPVSLR